jgi:hypothetical protein
MEFEGKDIGQIASPLNRKDERAKKRRRSFWLGIALPFVLGTAALGAGVYLVSRSGVGDASAWADASLSFLLIPMLLLCLIPLALIGALIYGAQKLIGWLPEPMGSLDTGMRRVNRSVRRVMEAGLKPLISIKGFWAAWKAAFAQLRISNRRGAKYE